MVSQRSLRLMDVSCAGVPALRRIAIVPATARSTSHVPLRDLWRRVWDAPRAPSWQSAAPPGEVFGVMDSSLDEIDLGSDQLIDRNCAMISRHERGVGFHSGCTYDRVVDRSSTEAGCGQTSEDISVPRSGEREEAGRKLLAEELTHETGLSTVRWRKPREHRIGFERNVCR